MVHSITNTQINRISRRNKIIVLCIWLIIWQITSMVLKNNVLLPTPESTMKSLYEQIKTLVFWKSIGNSLGKITIGYLAAWLLGIIMASLAYKYQSIRQFLSPFINVIKAIPIASFIILILVWVKSEFLSIWISFLVVFPMIYIPVLEGLHHIDQELLEMSKVYQVRPIEKIRSVYLSEVMPYLIAATRTALGMCFKSGISAEIIGLPVNSIGEQLYLSKIYLNISDLFAWTIVIILLSYVFERIFLWILLRLEHKIIIC